jgi:hypothetical protein
MNLDKWNSIQAMNTVRS